MVPLSTLVAKWLAGLWLAAAVLLSLVAGSSAQPTATDPTDRPKFILFLQSYGPSFQPFATWSQETRSELIRQSPWPLTFQEHSLVTAVAGNDSAEAQFVAYLTSLYAQTPPDLIVAFGGPAARFVQKYRAGLFPTAPMLLAAVNSRRVDPSLLSPRDAVVGTLVEHAPLFENILRLLPETKTIAVVVGNSPPEQFWIKELRQEVEPVLGDRVELRFYNGLPFAETLRELANLPPRSAIFFQQMMVDGAGAVYGDKEPLKSIADVANAPIFTFDQSLFHGRVVGGPMTSPVEGARSSATVAVRMLGGEKPDGIHVSAIPFSAPKYDWRELRRWNISESRLPPGSEVLFREPTPWQRYPLEISLVAVAVLLQAGLIAVLLRERHRRHLAEVESQQRMSELARVNRFTTAGELGASIAHEINQPLGAILANAEAAHIILESQSPDIPALREIVGEILHNDERASAVIKRMRSLLKKAPFELKNLDLNDLARETIGFFSTLAHARDIELATDIQADPLPVLGDGVQLQQVILNLVVNAMEATKDLPDGRRAISIRTSRDAKFAELSVSDRGPGIPEDTPKRIFDPFFTTKPEGMGMGLSIAQTIIQAHHGKITARNREDGGASFTIRLPLAT